jgi:hypothetical protein
MVRLLVVEDDVDARVVGLILRESGAEVLGDTADAALDASTARRRAISDIGLADRDSTI